MNRRTFLGTSGTAAFALGAMPQVALAHAGSDPATDWTIGPVIRGRNYSAGMPLHPTEAGRGWFFDFPGPRREDGHVHYVTRATVPLDRARGLRLRYRIDARPGTRFVPQEHPDLPGTISLYIQRAGDDWNGRGATEFSRWYSPGQTVRELSAGEHEIVILFDENWRSVMGSNRRRNPDAFRDALANAATVGMTFGSRRARGHGVFATAPARFTLLEFAVI
ncbi:MAG: hypothetical protein WBA68_11650 [Alteraurantiacibacter sp.]